MLKGTHLDPSRLTGHSKDCCISTLWLPKFPKIQPSRRDYSSVSNPLSLGSIAIQSQVLSSEVKKTKGEEKDLIPRKCSTTCQGAAEKTVDLPTGLLSPGLLLGSTSTSRVFHLTSIKRMCQSNTLQAGRLGGPLLCSLVASLHLSRFQKRGKGIPGRLGWRIRTPTWWG